MHLRRKRVQQLFRLTCQEFSKEGPVRTIKELRQHRGSVSIEVAQRKEYAVQAGELGESQA